MNNEARITKVSLLEYCIKQQNNNLFQNILGMFDPLKIERSNILSALKNAYELVFRNKNKQMLQILMDHDYRIVAQNERYLGVHEGPCLMEAAVVYNRPDILDQSFIQMKYRYNQFSSEYKQKLIELCFVLEHTACGEVLSKHGIHTSSQSWQLDIANQIHRLLYLYVHYHHSRDEIQSRLQNMQNIQEKINIPFDNRVTHLQWFIVQCRFNSNFDLDVIKFLLKLGAHVEVHVPELKKGTMFIRAPIYDRPLRHILNNFKDFKGHLRPLLELLLFANPSTALDKRNDLPGFRVNDNTRKDSLGIDVDVTECFASIIHPEMFPGVYIMNNEIRPVYECSDLTDPAVRFVLPKLIESGFKFPEGVLEKALNSYIHPEEKLYLKSCLEVPQRLTKCCRDVLRRHFQGQQIHKFVKSANIPKPIRNFILLKHILPSVKSFEL